jgi:hypothetical protein
MIFIKVGLGGTSLGSISRRTLHSYSMECTLFQFGICCCNDIMKLYKATLYFLPFHIFCCNDVMSNGGGDGHSTMRDGKNVTSINYLFQLGVIWQVEYEKCILDSCSYKMDSEDKGRKE